MNGSLISDFRRTYALFVWALLTAVLVLSVLLPQPGADGRIAGLPSVCLFYHLTGLPCPGCGLTRSFVFLGHADWQDALRWHPLGPAIYGVFGLLWLRCGLFWMRGITVLPMTPRTVNRLSAAGGIVLIVAWAGRLAWLSAHHLRF